MIKRRKTQRCLVLMEIIIILHAINCIYPTVPFKYILYFLSFVYNPNIMTVKIHPSWYMALAWEFEKLYWWELTEFIKSEYSQKRCFPEGKNIFRAFDTTPFDAVKVVILGQDPYHTAYSPSFWGTKNPEFQNTEHGLLHSSQWQKPVCAAMWLSFSVPEWSKPQPSLRNIFKELESDTGIKREKTDLTDWAEQGVLLLNAVLTVREWEPASHQKMWWENFTDAAIEALSQKREWIVFILWGNYAIAKKSLIDASKHHIITSPHPSPFSAHNGFFGSKPFTRTNQYLVEQGQQGIVWR